MFAFLMMFLFGMFLVFFVLIVLALAFRSVVYLATSPLAWAVAAIVWMGLYLYDHPGLAPSFWMAQP